MMAVDLRTTSRRSLRRLIGPVLDREPVEFGPRLDAQGWSDARINQATWAFVALGVAIRLIRFLAVHPLWGDECFVAANLIDRGFSSLLQPLDYQQVAPPLFLGLELAATRLFGFSEASLRVFPTVAAILGLILFRHMASRIVRGLPMMLAVAVMAVATNPIRHGGEAKPYAFDFLASMTLVAMAVEWWRRPDRSRWIWGLAALTPVAIGLSFPSVFVAGGISLVIFPVGSAIADLIAGVESKRSAIADPTVAKRGRRRVLAYLAFNSAILVSFAMVSSLNSGERADSVKAYMDHYWSAFFLPLDGVFSSVRWLILAHSGDLLAYPVGGPRGASLVSMACVVVAMVALWRRGRSMVVALTVAPLGLALVASAFRRYPYGENERIMQFAGPMLCLMVGVGAAIGLGRLRNYRKASIVVVGLLGMIGIGSIVADVVQPTKTVADLRTREFYGWFWAEAGLGAELVCVRVDLGLDFEPGPSHHGRSADYLTYQRIFSVRTRPRVSLPILASPLGLVPGGRGLPYSATPESGRTGRATSVPGLRSIADPFHPESVIDSKVERDIPRPISWRDLSNSRPLRCVIYGGVPVDSMLFDRWIAGMNRHYRLVKADTYRANSGLTGKSVSSSDHLVVLEFTPIGSPVDPSAISRAAREE